MAVPVPTRAPARAHRLLALAITALLASSLTPAPSPAQSHDPRLTWRTMETTHFRVHYPQGLRPVASRVAEVSEGVYDRIGTLMGWHPSEIVEILVSDASDDANGLASVFPYNHILVYTAAPEDLSELSDYDDYIQQLVTHEFTHIAHMDNIHGIPALINAIFGKIYPPNSAQPAWILEGMAVFAETRFTTSGRLRSSTWNMFLRADALADHFVGFDQLCSGGGNRWPHGVGLYLYGSFFIQYIVDRFGDRVLSDIATEYGQQTVPIAINRTVLHATGQTYEQLYPAFLASVRERVTRERAAIEARGLREGVRVTTQGEQLFYPRFLPDGHTVAYQSSDGDSHTQLRTIALGHSEPRSPRPVAGEWTDAMTGFALDTRAQRMIVSDVGFHRGIYPYHELYDSPVRLEADGRLVASDRTARTDGARARYPDLSPDDDHVAFACNQRGSSDLCEYSLADGRTATLVRSPEFGQIYTPRYSPDGRSIAYSQWLQGGYRDIVVYDRATRAQRRLTHDRAVDMQPVFTPDGRWIVWCSDRTGVPNLYAYELATGTERQVTNVLTGAYMPALSPDGRTLVYVGYSTSGWDLYRMPFDSTQWLDAPASFTREGERLPTPAVTVTDRPYRPWITLRPHYFGVDIGSDGFGAQLGLFTMGSDIVGNHAYAARVALGLARGDPSFDLAYTFGGLRPTLGAHLYRTVVAAPWTIGSHEVNYADDRWGGEANIAIDLPAQFYSNTLGLSYEAQYARVMERLPYAQFADPNEPPPRRPFQGWVAGLRGSWSLASRTVRTTYGISTQEGYAGALSVHATDRALGSSYGSFDVSLAGAGYLRMPWGPRLRPHVLAVHASGGMGVRDTGARALWALGGFPTYSVGDYVASFVGRTSGASVALRGYPIQARVGDTFFFVSLEYRVPLLHVDRGISSLPVYLTRLYASAVLDVGNAFFGSLRADDIAVGAAAEFLMDVIVGWYFAYTVRIGVAQGLRGNDAMLQGYGLLSAPF